MQGVLGLLGRMSGRGSVVGWPGAAADVLVCVCACISVVLGATPSSRYERGSTQLRKAAPRPESGAQQARPPRGSPPPDKHPARRAMVWPAGGPAGHITFKHMADCHCGSLVANQTASATSAECLTAQAQCWFGLATGSPGGAGRGLWGGWAAGGGAYTAHMEHT